MSEVADLVVTLHHLSPDLKEAGANFPDNEQKNVTPVKLRAWLEALVRLAPKVEFPVTPELRIVGPRGRFLVQVKNGQVRLTSWSSNAGGSDLTPARILALIMGTEEEEAAAFAVEIAAATNPRTRWLKIVLLVAGVIATNGVTAWMLLKTPERVPLTLLPEYQVVTDDSAERIRASFAGEYETGRAQGDRALTIRPDGGLRWVLFGPNRTVAEETELTSEAAQSRGKPVLVAQNHGMIETKDPVTITYFGDHYRRKTK